MVSYELKEGDVVVLKSQPTGPKMTIVIYNEDTVQCVWFEERKPFRQEYKLTSLQVAVIIGSTEI